MFEGYTVFNNGSKEVRDMENFFKENNVEYITVYKSADSRALIFPPENLPPYKTSEFNSLRNLILEGIEEKI